MWNTLPLSVVGLSIVSLPPIIFGVTLKTSLAERANGEPLKLFLNRAHGWHLVVSKLTDVL
jgi:hypothetical protein